MYENRIPHNTKDNYQIIREQKKDGREKILSKICITINKWQ